jgi:hypothetical protein
MSGTLRSAAASAELHAGLVMGVLALVVGLLAALPGRGRASPVPVAGLLFVVALAAGVQLTIGLPGEPVPGPLLGLLIVVPAVGTAALLADFDVRWRHRGLGPVLLTVSLLGVYATVPDTEMALVAVGVALPLSLLGWPWPLAAWGRAGALAVAGSLLWVVASGGVGRGSAVIGGIACLGLLAVEPIARRLHPHRRSVLSRLPDGPLGAPVVAAVQLPLVYVASRVAGTRSSVAAAAAIAMAGGAVAVGLALAASGKAPEDRAACE